MERPPLPQTPIDTTRIQRAFDRSTAARYAFAVAMIAIAVGLRRALDPLIGNDFPFLPLFPAIILVGWACGRAPALAAVALGALATIWFVLEPRGAFGELSPHDATGTTLFLLAALPCVLIADAQRMAERAVRHTESERRRSERQASALLASLPNGAGFVVDETLCIELAEGSLPDVLGVPARTLAGRSAADVLAPLGGDEASFRQGLAGTAFEREAAVGDRIVAWRGVPLRDDEERVYAVLATANDVTDRRRARDAQRESERRLRSLANAMPQLVWMADGEGRVHYYNSRVDSYAGLKRSDDGTWGWSAVVHSDDLATTDDAWRVAQRSGAPYAAEHRLRMMDGSWRWHLSRAVRGRDAADAVTWYGTATDIHELKSTEASLRENARRALLAIRVGRIGTWRYDPESGEVEMDERMTEIWGGGTSKASIEHVLQRIHPDDSDRVVAAVAAAIEPGGDGRYDIEYRIVWPDGSERWVIAAGQVEFSDGRAVLMIGTARDITERRRYEEALRRSEERYRAFVANSSEGIWCIEFDPPIDTSLPAEAQVDLVYARGRYVECNEAMARMYGLEGPEQLIGESLALMLPPDDPAARAYLHSIIDSGYSVHDAESEEHDATGETRWFLNGVRAVIVGGRMVRVWGTQRDITDNKRAEAARAEVARRLGDGAASA